MDGGVVIGGVVIGVLVIGGVVFKSLNRLINLHVNVYL
jgi:hypothetical protein